MEIQLEVAQRRPQAAKQSTTAALVVAQGRAQIQGLLLVQLQTLKLRKTPHQRALMAAQVPHKVAIKLIPRHPVKEVAAPHLTQAAVAPQDQVEWAQSLTLSSTQLWRRASRLA